MKKSGFFSRLQTRWGLASPWQALLVLVVFALTGTTVVYLKRPILAWIGPDLGIEPWLFSILYFIAILPVYQVVLLAYGFVFGLFDFFWQKEVKLFQRIARALGPKPTKIEDGKT